MSNVVFPLMSLMEMGPPPIKKKKSGDFKLKGMERVALRALFSRVPPQGLLRRKTASLPP